MPTDGPVPCPDRSLPPPDASLWMLGIGGCGVSGLARLLAARGIRVGGSDEAASDVTRGLEADGRLVLDVVPEDVSRGDVYETKLINESVS